MKCSFETFELNSGAYAKSLQSDSMQLLDSDIEKEWSDIDV